METSITEGIFNITFTKDEVVSISIYAGTNYNSASVRVKQAKDEYFSCNSEWEGMDSIPSFVLNVMSLVKATSEKATLNGKKYFYVNKELQAEYDALRKDS